MARPAMLKAFLVVGGVVAAAVALLSFTPLPGYCNATVSVANYEYSIVVGTIFTIQSVNPSVNGKATILDWGGWLPAGFAWAQLSGTFKETVCVGPSCTSKVETQLVPSLPYLNGATLTATDSYSLAYVPLGSQPVTVTLTDNGQNVASGSSSLGVSC